MSNEIKSTTPGTQSLFQNNRTQSDDAGYKSTNNADDRFLLKQKELLIHIQSYPSATDSIDFSDFTDLSYLPKLPDTINKITVCYETAVNLVISAMKSMQLHLDSNGYSYTENFVEHGLDSQKKNFSIHNVNYESSVNILPGNTTVLNILYGTLFDDELTEYNINVANLNNSLRETISVYENILSRMVYGSDSHEKTLWMLAIQLIAECSISEKNN